ncbi:MAG: tetratricopeptide repeat protein, partial [Chloroflexota bacterium]
MLATIREYAQERLAAAGELDEVCGRHARFFLLLAEEAEGALQGPEQSRWLTCLEWEHDNLRAAIDWASAAGELALALRLAGALGPFWRTRCYVTEGLGRLEALLAKGNGVAAAVQAKALSAAGSLAMERGQLTRAGTFFAESLACSQQTGESRQVAQALLGLAGIALLQGELASAEARYRQIVTLAREVGHSWELARALNDLALTLYRLGNLTEANERAEQSLRLFRTLEDRQGEARGLLALGDIAYARGDLAQAGSWTGTALAVLRQAGDRQRIGNVLARQAQIAAEHGDDPQALASSQESLA